MEPMTPLIAAASGFYWIPFALIFIALLIALWAILRETGDDLDQVEEREP